MAAYIDAPLWSWMGLRWCHLLADSLDELHEFADQLGLPRMVFQCPPHARFPHYDLSPWRRRRALRLGAIEIGHREVVHKARRLRHEFLGAGD